MLSVGETAKFVDRAPHAIAMPFSQPRRQSAAKARDHGADPGAGVLRDDRAWRLLGDLGGLHRPGLRHSRRHLRLND